MAATISLIGYFTPNMSLQWSWLIFGSHLLQQNCFGMKLLLQNFPCNSDNIYIWFNTSINVTTVTISYCSKHFVAINHQYMVQRYSNKTCKTSQKKKKIQNMSNIRFVRVDGELQKRACSAIKLWWRKKPPFFMAEQAPFCNCHIYIYKIKNKR